MKELESIWFVGTSFNFTDLHFNLVIAHLSNTGLETIYHPSLHFHTLILYILAFALFFQYNLSREGRDVQSVQYRTMHIPQSYSYLAYMINRKQADKACHTNTSPPWRIMYSNKLSRGIANYQ